MDFVERFRVMMQHYGLSSLAFSERIGVSQATITHILNGRNKMPSTDVLLKVASAFPELSESWLLIGKGPMLRTGQPSDEAERPSVSGDASKTRPSSSRQLDLFHSFDNEKTVYNNKPDYISNNNYKTERSDGTVLDSVSLPEPENPKTASPSRPAAAAEAPSGSASLAGSSPASGEDGGAPPVVRMTPSRRIREVRIFYDDSTYEVLRPFRE